MTSTTLPLTRIQADRTVESVAELKKSNPLNRIAASQSNAAINVPVQAPVLPPAAKTSWWIAAVILVVAAAAAYFQPWQSSSEPVIAQEIQPHDAARVVAVDRPTAAGASSVVLPATIRPWQAASLHARVSGYLSSWKHDIGATVKAGELLAEIDTPELDQELAEAEGLAREAIAAAVQAKAERVEAEADLKVAEAKLESVKAEVELAQAQFARREKLLERRAITQEEHETFQRDLSVRGADVVAAQAEVSRRRANLETRSAVIQVREATARSRQSSVDRLQELQTFKRIVAPFDGVVTRRAAEVGMLVTAGQESLFVVEDTNRVRVQVHVPQTYAAETSPGSEATITLPESTMGAVAGTITRTSESVDESNRTMLAEIELDNSSNHFQPGSYARVTIQTHSAEVWTISTNTLQMRVEGPHVAVVNQQDQVEIKPVSLGRDLGSRVVVIDGIRGDEWLVVNPGDELTSGARVQVSEEESTQAVAQR